MIGRIRRKLREVNEYSARRETSAWTRASDLWLLASLPMAVCATAFLALLARSDATTPVASGWLMRLPHGEVVAAFAAPDAPIELRGIVTNSVEVHQRHEQGGWPLIVWEHVHTPVIMIREGEEWRPVALKGFDEPIAALRQGLAVTHPALAQRCFEPPVHRVHYAALAGIMAVTWIALMPLGVLAILVLRFGAGVMTATEGTRRRSRRDRGLCPRCGYPVRGLEFVNACPECGELLT